jgi:hypothetical protein
VTGYDLCTGWGTPNGQKLINALANPEALQITPNTGFTSLGGVGGPFTVTAQSFSLTNTGTNTLTWNLVNTSSWLNASASGGTLVHGGPATNVVVSLNSVASNLLVGTYNATLWFTNLNDQIGQGRSFALSVLSPPTITSQPTNQSALDGATTTFTVTATGGLPLYYQWQYNSNDLTDGGNISGCATTNLIIGNVSGTNVGSYRVILSNAAGSIISSNALLTIAPSPPMITQEPPNQGVVAGTTARFSVLAIGTKPFSYQWVFNTTNLTGATNASLILNNVQLNQAGTYAVVVSNTLGAATSSNATLSVFLVPVITSFSPQAGSVGTNVTITGLNFSPAAGSNIVYFGGVRATVTAASPTNLVVTMPGGATFAPITVTANGLTAYADQPFVPTFAGSGQIDSSSFGPQLVLPTASGPIRVVIADLDGDGKPDLIVADAYAGEISLFRNISTNGTLTAGSFAPRVDLVVGAGTSTDPYTVVAADLDGDGKLDIVALNADNDTVSIFRNISSPGSLTTNSFAPRMDLPAGNTMRALAVQDLNGDGKPELVTANWSDNTFSVFQNQSTIGNISFAPRVDFAAGSGTQGLAIGDLDGDGQPDVVVADSVSSSTGSLMIFRNLGAGGNITSNFFAAGVSYPALSSCFPIAIGDMDGDGKLDLVVGGGNGGQAVWVYRNTSTVGTITTNSFAPPVSFGAGGWVNTLALGDLDGDGRPDVALVSQISSLFSVFKNVSTPGSFTNGSLAARVDYASGSNPNGVAIGDLDGDGRPDVVFANSYDNTIWIYQNEISLGGPPVITAQPTNQTVIVGQAATLSVGATGAQPLNYQWFFGSNSIVGQTNSALVLNDVQLTNAGIYSVTVTNSYGSTISSNAILTALAPATIITQPTNRTVYVGGTASFGVAASGTLPLGYQWNFNQTNIANATNTMLVLTNVQLNQAGIYTVLVTNRVNSILSSNAVLAVNLPPALGASAAGNTLYIFWPASAPGFELETAPSLSPPNWVTVSNPPIQIGDEYLQSIPMTGTNQFYRLQLSQ